MYISCCCTVYLFTEGRGVTGSGWHRRCDLSSVFRRHTSTGIFPDWLCYKFYSRLDTPNNHHWIIVQWLQKWTHSNKSRQSWSWTLWAAFSVKMKMRMNIYWDYILYGVEKRPKRNASLRTDSTFELGSSIGKLRELSNITIVFHEEQVQFWRTSIFVSPINSNSYF